MKKRVCILYTGGTIGMVSTNHGYAPLQGHLQEALDAIPELLRPEIPDWDLLEFNPLLDSSDITAREWNQIGAAIRDNYAIYDGFVVLHGTDTMAYTASALSFMLEGLSKPVILTGSQIPIGELRTDARDNLINALLIAADGLCNEVCLFFGGKLLRGNRATKVSSDELWAFDSPNFPPLATAGISIRYNDNLLLPPGKTFRFTPCRPDIPIAVLKIFPGIQFQLFEGIVTESLRGIVLESFGAGNIPQHDHALLPLVEKAVASGTIITVCTQCLRGRVQLGAYEASAPLRQAGAISGFDMTVEAAVTKLYSLLSQDLCPEDIRRAMEENLRGELSL